MSTAARVDSTDAIKDFRVYLTKFQESASLALGDADSDVNRAVRWLEGEGLNLWLSAIRKRQEEVAKAEEAFRFKRLYKDASGSMPSAIEEQKAVQNAKKRLAEAQEKLASVKKWTRQLQKEIVMYRGGVSRFAGTVSSGVPAAIAHLGTKLDELDKYMEISAGPAGEGPEAAAAAGGAVREGPGASMARAPEEAAVPKKAEAVDPAAIRAGAPSAQATFAAKPEERGPVKTSCGVVTAEQAAKLAAIAAAAPPGDDDRIVISPAVMGSGRIYLLRLSSPGANWCLGSVDGPDSGVYNTVTAGDLRAGRPDLAPLLKLPAGSLAIVDSNGVSVVFNERNENILQPPESAGGPMT
ncbi:MAG: hypothetical protein ABSB33_05980 [Tepidisphaeraceae bacterium]|jgi:hypothetical protein